MGALVGAVVLSAVAPVAAHAEPAACERWEESALPVPDAVRGVGVVGAAGAFAVGNGGFKDIDGTVVLIWKAGQLFDQLSFSRNPVSAADVNSSGAVILTSYLFPAAARYEDGRYTTLTGHQGETRVEALDLNERGDVLGRSEGKPVVWPAGSGEAQPVPGTDASWTPIGITDDGTVLASSASGTFWFGAAGPVRLAEADEVTAVRGSHAVGRSGAKISRWDSSGQPSASYADAEEALDVNSHGHLLGTVRGSTAVWSDPDRYAPLNTSARFGSLTDDGDAYGTVVLDSWNSYPVVLRCAAG
ncbi:hypothetical protein BBK82_23045 [Lentzea guizhouensis]|uniref:HAF repeat-containing protein n=1 Tax=Lentzea guizhouensis TaxID=1586287 RepID=A0A1B2HLB2_9PSEU|nr:hypothetical protein BBK82_23045 [Lentzea guizhouensis]